MQTVEKRKVTINVKVRSIEANDGGRILMEIPMELTTDEFLFLVLPDDDSDITESVKNAIYDKAIERLVVEVDDVMED